MSPALRILKPGILTTVQDLGRIGFQHLGVAASGALDPVGLQAANALVGNAFNTGVLEAAYVGPTFVVDADSVQLACVGADAVIEILPDERASRGTRIPTMRSFQVHRGEVVRIGAISGSALLYIAVEGGFAIEPVLGSVSTFIRGAIGGWQGRSLVAGDLLPLQRNDSSGRDDCQLDGLNLLPPDRFRVILGPQHTFFSERAIKTFFDSEYSVKPSTDRMAIHLDGPKLEHLAGHDIVSDGIALGSIQVPGHGNPLILMADRQTTGGYPKIATVISADLPALGRTRIGDTIAFEQITIEEARFLRSKLVEEIRSIPTRIVPTRRSTDIVAHLLGSNLISGAINAQSPQIVD
jgi:biotin-dependent carboxylase-like uncharacterized protein